MTKDPLNPTEAEEQKALFRWARDPLMLRQYPALRLLIAIPNGGWFKNEAYAKSMLGMGLTPGVSDVFLPVPRIKHQCERSLTYYHGCWIELKRRKCDDYHNDRVSRRYQNRIRIYRGHDDQGRHQANRKHALEHR